MRLGVVIIKFNGGANSRPVVFYDAFIEMNDGCLICVHQVKRGVSHAYRYEPNEINTMVILPGDRLASEVEQIRKALS